VALPYPRDAKYTAADGAAVAQVLAERHLSDIARGRWIAELEDAFAALTASSHALSFNSGTASLHAAVHAAGATPERGVLVSPMTWISALTAVFQAGSYPVFADIAPDRPTLAPAALTAAAVEQCAAALVTHAWGIPARMDELAAANTLPLIEDCSHAHGAIYAGRPVGSWGVAGCFSLQESKSVSGGEGGVLTTSDREIYERAMSLGHHPVRLTVELTLPGLTELAATGAAYKYRMPVLSAAIALQQLRALPARMDAAEANLALLREVLDAHGTGLRWPDPGERSVRGWYGTAAYLPSAPPSSAVLRQKLSDAGVPLRSMYEDWIPTPLLQDPNLAARFWPHLRHSAYRPPDPDQLPNYRDARERMLVLKIPNTPAADYTEQVGHAIAAVLARTFEKGTGR
jgi:dTDP-4-amino-4,6-dideoxygalactose transaminase